MIIDLGSILTFYETVRIQTEAYLPNLLFCFCSV